MGAKIVLASDGAALQLLKAEFPHLTACQLPSYHIRYRTKSMVWNIAGQLPRITYAIRAEQQMTEQLVREHNIAGIISDNRYGCFSRWVPSVILTHQLHLKVPNAALQWSANQVLRRALRKFDTIWIPDVAGDDNLSGELSHPPLRGFTTKYIGLLSRFTGSTLRTADEEEQPTVAVVLSGPEPQRTVLEHILLEQALSLPHKFVFVKGRTNVLEHHIVAENVEVISYLTSSELHELFQKSAVVVCRAGYSSLMDLVALGHTKAILIPTPGQTEQEYLGALFASRGMFICQNQETIDMESGLRALEQNAAISMKLSQTSLFEETLENWLLKLS
jgi:UDP-N-acetylglucosamine transferase subunit ALG13